MTYFEPHDAGPDSEPIEAGKRIARLDEEMLRWLKTGPEKVVLYVKHPTADKGWRVTTWLGTVVGTAYCTVRYRIGFGGGYNELMEENMRILYKVSMRNGRWKYGFETVESAIQYAGRIHCTTGIIAAIEPYRPKR